MSSMSFKQYLDPAKHRGTVHMQGQLEIEHMKRTMSRLISLKQPSESSL